ncbi:MAG: excisionase [Betaproteobacteria bacterium]|jgi:hypothetical protein|nr:excisionase [Betaproteobacteria bacterium]
MNTVADDTSVVQVQAASYVTIKLAAAITGLSEKAINGKIDEGIWLEGKEWRRGPDGRRYISLRGYAAWVERRRL